jgi:hypothetical protein
MNRDFPGETHMKNILIAATVILAFCSGLAYAQSRVESEKIQYLISSIENLAGAKFIRNGSEYEGKKAADHLRMKLKKAGSRIKTAEDFIRLCASQSYLSGQPYTIRFADGKTMKAVDYFRDRLTKYNPPAK